MNIPALARKAAEKIVGDTPLYRSLQTVTDCPQKEVDLKRCEEMVNRVARVIEETFSG
jgi:hypothetical protein